MLWVALSLVGCSSEEPELLTGVHDEAGNNPLVPERPLYPWPSDMFLEDDPNTATGRRLAVPAEHLPDIGDGSVFATHDGFSRVTPILTFVAGGVDPATLPALADTVEPESPVLLVNADTLERIPVLVELDGYARTSDQSLILRPQVALAPDAPFVVVVRSGVKRLDGTEIPRTDALAALLDRVPTDSNTVEAMRGSFEVVHAVVEGLALPSDDIRQAWSFHTRSAIVDPIADMHDQVMRATLGTWSEVSREDNGNNTLIVGTVDVPNFLDEEERIDKDDNGMFVQQGERPMEFLITIPHTVDEPRPVLVFGHGFFSAKEETTWGSLQQSLQPWRFPAVSTDFIGFTEDDVATSTLALMGQTGPIQVLVDQQLQAHANHTALARVIREQLGGLVVDGIEPLDVDQINYLGISNGGTQGFTLFATSPMYTRGALVVGGGGWSHITQRAVQWNSLGQLAVARFDDNRDVQVALALMQNLIDPIDSLNFTDHLLRDRLAGRPDIELGVHMAVGDSQVHNMTTEWVARAAGIPLVEPSPRQIWGLDSVPAANIESRAALVVYDEGFQPSAGNVAPEEDNGTHETIRDLLSYRENVGHFLETGEIVQRCDGPCDPD